MCVVPRFTHICNSVAKTEWINPSQQPGSPNIWSGVDKSNTAVIYPVVRMEDVHYFRNIHPFCCENGYNQLHIRRIEPDAGKLAG